MSIKKMKEIELKDDALTIRLKDGTIINIYQLNANSIEINHHGVNINDDLKVETISKRDINSEYSSFEYSNIDSKFYNSETNKKTSVIHSTYRTIRKYGQEPIKLGKFTNETKTLINK